ncbi:MAG: histone deacetylase [Xenococcaceae cyanobacterium MO_188.B29]|nr:histone deacetylase [Xenococcaceae cyanobacterium MO_188.B29]
MLPVIYSPDFLLHDTGHFHPEKPERLTAIVEGLKQVAWADRIDWQLPTSIQERETLFFIEQIHTSEYINRVKSIADSGGGYLDEDTPVSPQSYDIALLAVNAWLDGVDQVISTNNPVFVLARPPGHHATRNMGMGFCLFSNAAIAANYALQQPGIQRVAILDWDVHHGNGTEVIVEDNPQIIYCSIHQYPCYPGTGKKSDRGKHNNILNIPMSPGSTLVDYQSVFDDEVIPFLTNFQPDLIIVSAGYDANHQDTIANISLQPEDYSLFTDYLLKITRRLLFGLEGGYHLQTLTKSVISTLKSCL